VATAVTTTAPALLEQYTGFSPLGWNGTWAGCPQLEQVAVNISRAARPPPGE